MLAVVDPGDEVIVFEPFYENYDPDTILCDAAPVYVPMPGREELDLERLAAAFSDRTRAIVLNTPNNPTGRVVSRRDLEGIAELCRRHDAYAITDEIYEHIYYEGEHVPIATLDGMRDRTITISGASKTFAVTGWRIGTIVAPPEVTGAIRKVHDFLTVGAPAPLQEAVAVAMETLGPDYYTDMARQLPARRDVLVVGLQESGFGCEPPRGLVLRAVRLQRVERSAGRRVRRVAHGGAWRGLGARLELLPRSRRRPPAGALRLLQDRGDAGRGGRAPARRACVMLRDSRLCGGPVSRASEKYPHAHFC